MCGSYTNVMFVLVARKLLTMRMHELKNKDKVEVTEFSEHSSQDSEPPQQLESKNKLI